MSAEQDYEDKMFKDAWEKRNRILNKRRMHRVHNSFKRMLQSLVWKKKK